MSAEQLRQAVLAAINPDGYVTPEGVTALALLTYRGGQEAINHEIDLLPLPDSAKATLSRKVIEAIFIARRDARSERQER